MGRPQQVESTTAKWRPPLPNRRRPQRRNPLHARTRPEILHNPCVRDHPAIPDQHDPRQPKLLADLSDLRGQRLGIARIALEHLHRHRAPFPIRQEPKDDLQLVALAIARVAQPRQRTTPAFEVGRRDVVQGEGPLCQVTPRQLLLDPALAGHQPVHRLVQILLVLVRGAQPQNLPQGAVGRLGIQLPGRRELRARIENARNDHRHGPVPLRAPLGSEDLLEPDTAQTSQDRRDVTVRT